MDIHNSNFLKKVTWEKPNKFAEQYYGCGWEDNSAKNSVLFLKSQQTYHRIVQTDSKIYVNIQIQEWPKLKIRYDPYA